MVNGTPMQSLRHVWPCVKLPLRRHCTLEEFDGETKAVPMHKIQSNTIMVLKYKVMTGSRKLVWPLRNIEDFTAIGREYLERVRLEGERRFCGNITAFVDGKLPVEFNDGELLATLLGIQTVHCKHLT